MLIDPLNDHAVTTILSRVITSAYDVHCSKTLQIYYKHVTAASDSLMWNVFVCGISWYLYNEFQNIVLSSLGPTTILTTIGNTLKRVAVFVAFHYFVPGEELSYMCAALGCSIVTGCLLYALCDYWRIWKWQWKWRLRRWW